MTSLCSTAKVAEGVLLEVIFSPLWAANEVCLDSGRGLTPPSSPPNPLINPTLLLLITKLLFLMHDDPFSKVFFNIWKITYILYLRACIHTRRQACAYEEHAHTCRKGPILSKKEIEDWKFFNFFLIQNWDQLNEILALWRNSYDVTVTSLTSSSWTEENNFFLLNKTFICAIGEEWLCTTFAMGVTGSVPFLYSLASAMYQNRRTIITFSGCVSR